MTFSERHGYKPTRSVVQVGSLDDQTRIAIWNLLHRLVFGSIDQAVYRTSAVEVIEYSLRALWADLLGLDLDGFTLRNGVARVKTEVLDGEWYEVYDLLEFMVDDPGLQSYRPDLAESLNVSVLGKFMCGYRVVERRVVPVSDPVEVAAIEGAASVGREGVRDAMRRAIEDLSNRVNPDYADAVTQAISAVESQVTGMTGTSTLGDGLKKLEPKGFSLHPALVRGWGSIYGFTSNAGGLRHGGAEPAEVSGDLARYFVVTCSAMVNLLVSMESD